MVSPRTHFANKPVHARRSTFRRWRTTIPSMNSFPYLLGKTNKVRPTRRPRPRLPHHYRRPRLMYLYSGLQILFRSTPNFLAGLHFYSNSTLGQPLLFEALPGGWLYSRMLLGGAVYSSYYK